MYPAHKGSANRGLAHSNASSSEDATTGSQRPSPFYGVFLTAPCPLPAALCSASNLQTPKTMRHMCAALAAALVLLLQLRAQASSLTVVRVNNLWSDVAFQAAEASRRVLACCADASR